MTMQGSYFGLWLHSGQGGAFRQVGRTKIAGFAVENSVGAVADRDGRLCFGNQAIPTGESESVISSIWFRRMWRRSTAASSASGDPRFLQAPRTRRSVSW